MAELSEERLAPCNGIEIAYQEVGDPDGEPLILVMGLATQMIAWDEDFCSMLAERGFRVIRFDNRDIGHSTKLDGAHVPDRLDIFLRRRETARLPALRHGRRHRRPDGPPGNRLGPRGRHLDGRDDRPDDRDRASGPDPLAGLDVLDHRQPLGRPADASRSSPTCWPMRRAVATPSSSASSGPTR